jgi:hypothetical protein
LNDRPYVDRDVRVHRSSGIHGSSVIVRHRSAIGVCVDRSAIRGGVSSTDLIGAGRDRERSEEEECEVRAHHDARDSEGLGTVSDSSLVCALVTERRFARGALASANDGSRRALDK